MDGSDDAVPLFIQIMTLNRQAFATGNYNAAYHLLTAALYTAGDDLQYLAIVQQVTEEQLAEIDAAHPEYEHSTASTVKRGRRASISKLLALQARAQQQSAWLRQFPREHSTKPP